MLHLPLKHCHRAMFCQNEYGIKSLKIDDSYFHAFSIQTSSQSSVDVIATNKMAHNRTARLLVLLGIQAQTARLNLAPHGSNSVHLGPLGTTWQDFHVLCMLRKPFPKCNIPINRLQLNIIEGDPGFCGNIGLDLVDLADLVLSHSIPI